MVTGTRIIKVVPLVMMAVALWPDPVSAQAKDDTESDIIVTGRRPTAPQGRVIDTIPSATIKAYTADTIGELLDLLSKRFHSGFSVMVNGRRLATIESITALPPEALQQIEVLDPTANGQAGVTRGTTVVNLMLRPRFQSASIEGAASGTTEGGGDSETASLRYDRIRKDKRMNIALAYNRQAGLLQSDRSGSRPTGDEARSRSIVPRQSAVTLNSGYADRIGQLDAELSLEAGSTRTDTFTGPVARSMSEGTASSYDLSSQRNDIRYVRASATVSGSVSRFFWTMLANGEANWTDTANLRGGTLALSAPDLLGENIPTSLPDPTRATSRSAGITATMNGPLFKLPAGFVGFDGSSSIRVSDLTSIAPATPQSTTTNRYRTLAEHAGVSVPIAQRGTGWLGRLGDLTLRQSLDYLHASGVGGAIGTSSTLEWAPVVGLLVSINHDAAPSLPSVTQRFAPIVYQPGVLVYDAATAGIVPVTILTGGRDDIEKTTATATTALISYQADARFATVTGSLSYTVNQARNPLLSFASPSPFLQTLLPSLFVRNGSGTLVQFDARPFNGRSETARQITASLHLNGPGTKPPAGAKAGQAAALSTPPAVHALRWDVNASYGYTISHRLTLATSEKSLDLLTTPLSLATPTTARHHVSGQWSLTKGRLGLNGSLSWDSGSRTRAIDGGDGRATYFSAVTKIGVEGFLDLDRSKEEANPRSLRLKIGMDNILDQRVRVTGYRGFDSQTQQLLIDPYGRTFRVSIRKVM